MSTLGQSNLTPHCLRRCRFDTVAISTLRDAISSSNTRSCLVFVVHRREKQLLQLLIKCRVAVSKSADIWLGEGRISFQKFDQNDNVQRI